MCAEGKGVQAETKEDQGLKTLGTRLQGLTQPSSPGKSLRLFAGQENVGNPKQKEKIFSPFPPPAGPWIVDGIVTVSSFVSLLSP